MDEAVLQQAIMNIMKNDVFVQIIRDQVKEQVAVAVAEAVASRDAEIESLREELSETKAQLNCLEQYSRRLCLDVSGIPETANEDTDRLIMDTAKLAGVEIAKEDIDRSHRVGAVKPGKTRTLVVRFVTYSKREAMYGARKQLRRPQAFDGSTVSTATAENVFVTDNLTRENHFILYKARQYRKDGKLFAAWSDVGRLKVRLREGGPTVVIRSLNDLVGLVERGRDSGNQRREPAAAATTDGEGFQRVGKKPKPQKEPQRTSTRNK